MITFGILCALISLFFTSLFFIHNIFIAKNNNHRSLLVDLLALLNVDISDSWPNFILEGTLESIEKRENEPVNIEELHICHYSRGGVESVECAVCLSEMEDGDEIRELRCDHLFHRVCLEQWAGYGHGTCPLCRDVLAPRKPTGKLVGVLGFK